MILTNRVKVIDLIASTRPIKNTRLIIYYYYKKLDYLKLNYLNKDKESIEIKKRVIAIKINEIKINKIRLNINLDLFFSSRNI